MIVRQILIAAAVVALPLVAQTTPASSRHVRATGEAVVSARPDMARVAMGVNTEAATASDAAARNAELAAAVIAALRNLLGPNAEIRTVTYTLGPVYNDRQPNVTPTIRGFQANNIVEAIITDLSIIGRVIDAAIAAGANRVDSLQLGLTDEDPVRIQALTLAGRRARAKAEAIAQGVGVTLGAVLSAEEGYATTYPPGARGIDAVATMTPIETGSLQIRATVTLDLEAR